MTLEELIEAFQRGDTVESYVIERLLEQAAEIERLRAVLKICGAALGGHLSHAYAAHESHQQLQAAWKMIRDLDANQQTTQSEKP